MQAGLAQRIDQPVELGWEPKVPLEEGLKKTIDHFDGLLKTSNRLKCVRFDRGDRRRHVGDRRLADSGGHRIRAGITDRRHGLPDRRRQGDSDSSNDLVTAG